MKPHLAAGTVGLMQTPNSSYTLDGIAVWALDNGAYTGTYPGDDTYLRLLTRWDGHRERCLFVAIEDVVGDAVATLDKFPRMAQQVRAAGWPVALVAQDGMRPDMVPWDRLDWLFIGGTDTFKLGPHAVTLIRAAQQRGKRVHVGRVNSRQRYRRFRALGCDSVDGTFIAFGPKQNLPAVLSWVSEMQLGETP